MPDLNRNGAVLIRPLERSEWRVLRDLRLFALRSEPGVFASSYEREAPLTAADWHLRIDGPDCRIFGLFDAGRLVGITGVYTSRDDPSRATAVLIMSYLLPEYRGRGLSGLVYDARLAWLRERPRFERVIVSHRRSNEASRRANQRYGFVEIAAVSTTWPDGGVEDEVTYELRLSSSSRTGVVTDTTLVEVTDDDFAAMLRGDAFVREGLAVPPGGVDDPAVLAHVRAIAARLHHNGYSGGHWMVVSGGEVVGLCGFKAPPSADGDVEIGYGIAASRQRRGHATRAVAALVESSRHDPAIRFFVAETLAENAASQRALRANGFERAGTRLDPADGELIRWRLSSTVPRTRSHCLQREPTDAG